MAEEIENLSTSTAERMEMAVEALKHDFAAVRTGKASPALVEGLTVDYYGTSTRLQAIAGITTPEARLIVIQPWDQNAIKSIEKAIQASNLGISPVSDGRVIRLPVPELSEERRRDLAKLVHKRAEEGRVEIRNIRRDANDAARKAEKHSDITEDDLADLANEIQELTDAYIDEIDTLLDRKDAELMHV